MQPGDAAGAADTQSCHHGRPGPPPPADPGRARPDRHRPARLAHQPHHPLPAARLPLPRQPARPARPLPHLDPQGQRPAPSPRPSPPRTPSGCALTSPPTAACASSSPNSKPYPSNSPNTPKHPKRREISPLNPGPAPASDPITKGQRVLSLAHINSPYLRVCGHGGSSPASQAPASARRSAFRAFFILPGQGFAARVSLPLR